MIFNNVCPSATVAIARDTHLYREASALISRLTEGRITTVHDLFSSKVINPTSMLGVTPCFCLFVAPHDTREMEEWLRTGRYNKDFTAKDLMFYSYGNACRRTQTNFWDTYVRPVLAFAKQHPCAIVVSPNIVNAIYDVINGPAYRNNVHLQVLNHTPIASGHGALTRYFCTRPFVTSAIYLDADLSLEDMEREYITLSSAATKYRNHLIRYLTHNNQPPYRFILGGKFYEHTKPNPHYHNELLEGCVMSSILQYDHEVWTPKEVPEERKPKAFGSKFPFYGFDEYYLSTCLFPYYCRLGSVLSIDLTTETTRTDGFHYDVSLCSQYAGNLIVPKHAL